MFHCHILDHAEAGMMGHFIVRDPNGPALKIKGHTHGAVHSPEPARETPPG
jgi:hypothetical protein